ncbi:hypothetical protein C1645_870575 [Glomus cerebriforme]|uniref:F-box domain-containing protein n=1 Tax=Glomus cerebriforme TaxID=658196 RepID=A0A397TQC4_9GLOM|nr:hypothetical protein C1645_870575 [Glomus cerebriforme]
MAAYLTADCLANIFSYFDADPHSLHSFLLVNRHWCINAVPILWRRTFFITAHGYFSSKSRCRLITTYLSCLISNSLNSDGGITITSHNNFPSARQIQPTFDYASFLRGFDYFQVFHAIGNWYAYQSSEKKQSIKFSKIIGMDDDECKILLTTKELIKHILSRSPVIDYLALDSEATIPSDFISIGNFQNATNCLAYIRTFICRGNSNKLDLYTTFAKIVSNAENITIHGIGSDDSRAEGLSSFIRKQRNLSKFVLWDGTKEQLPNVIKALSFNHGKLKYLEFRFCSFENFKPLELLATACSELTTLKFIQCGEISSNIVPSSFPDLEVLDLQGTYFSADTLETIFRHANIDLRSINIEANSHRYPHMIEKLASYCPNLTKIHARLSKDGMSQLISLFRSCTHLETIILQGQLPDRLNMFTQDAIDNLLINLREVIPASLKNFVIKTDCAFTASAVDTFLRECKANLNRLEFISYGNIWQHLNVIKKYARRRRLEIKQEVAGNYRELLMRELGHVVVEFE